MMFGRSVPFVFNSRDALALIFTDSLVTPVQYGAPVIVNGSPYAIATPYRQADLPQLGYAQVGNVMTLVHPNYPPYELTRVANNNWTLVAVTFGALVQPPTGVGLLPASLMSSIDGDLWEWEYVVTSIGPDGEESLMSASDIGTSALLHNTPLRVFWSAPASGPAPASYRVYRRPPQQSGASAGAYGLVGVTTTPQYVDQAHDPDFTQQPPVGMTPFSGAGNYPSAVGFWQQRRVFANTNTNPDTAYASQTGRFTNYNVSVPSKDDDAVTFRVVSETVDAIRHIFAEGALTLLAEGGEWPVYGDRNGVLTPSTINPRKQSSHGVGLVRPATASGRLLFPQALGTTVLGLNDTTAAQYTGQTAQDLTLFSTHLFDGHQIVDLAWQQETPHVAWIVRDDGVLLGLTYVPDQDIVAWHRHDMDGIVESVCVIPELVGTRLEHRVYAVVGRAFGVGTSGASITHTIEVFTSPFHTAIDQEAWFVDGGVEYDGRATQLPVSSVSGLDHLETRAVAIYAFGKVTGGVSDGLTYVLANPLRSDLSTVTVTNGSVALGASYLRVVVGLPYIADLETLDLDAPDGPTMKTQKTNFNRVGLEVVNSRNLWACGGDLPADATPTANMDPLALSTDADYEALVSDFVEINTQGQWNTHGRVALRSIDPTPFTVLSAVPEGYIPNPQQG